jgi:hypothetical protein
METPKQIAENLLAQALPRRWAHVQAVAATAEGLGKRLFDAEEAEVLVSAAWFHDIGYAPDLAVTGFHPLDGARWLAARGVDARLAALVAHHSCSVVKVENRDWAEALSLFPREESLVADSLLYADLTTGPDGQKLSFQARLADIRARHDKGHFVTHFINKAEPLMAQAIRRVETALSNKGF